MKKLFTSLKWLFIFATVIFIGVFIANHSSKIRKSPNKIKTQYQNKIPSVSGKIVIALLAPNEKDIALIVDEKYPDSKLKLVLFNISTKKKSNYFANIDKIYGWSEDSRFVAVRNQSLGVNMAEGLSIIDLKNPSEIKIIDSNVYLSAWLNHILYYWESDNETIIKYDIQTNIKTKIAVKHRLYGLFLINNQVCYAYQSEKNIIKIRDLNSKLIFQITTKGKYEDYVSDEAIIISVSPDGSYFFISSGASDSSINILSKVADSEIIFKKPLASIYWQYLLQDMFSVKWFKNKAVLTRYGYNGPINPQIIDLETRNNDILLYEWMESIDDIFFLKQKIKKDNIYSYDYLFVDNEGLKLGPSSISGLILRNNHNTK